jgi:deoxyribodipyrimidine photo-lyase
VSTKRVRKLNRGEWQAKGRFVLYWAQMNRRVDSNHALAYAVELANEHQLPVLFYEGLTCSHPSANDRFHTFLLEGVPETEARLKKLGIGYLFHLRRRNSDSDNVFYQLAAHATAVVTDDYPVYITREHNAHVPARIPVPYYAVDSSCIVPMGAFDKQEYAAYTIRPKIHRMLPEFLKPVEPLSARVPFAESVLPELCAQLHTEVTDENVSELVKSCEIDHSVPPSTEYRGGRREAENRLQRFLEQNLARYAKYNREPSAKATSSLSPYLHFGQISSLEVALAVREYAARHKLIADEFLEELIVRRELAFNFARFSPILDSLEALPDWVQATLRKHAKDKREFVYSREQFEQAETHDALWNATQHELLAKGTIHGYYRMYWGKKIIEWSDTHEEALAIMIAFHDRYALDGRDPNTYTSILWCFGLHDRPWTERPVFGMIRYMSYDGMKRKTNVQAYIDEMTSPSRTSARMVQGLLL